MASGTYYVGTHLPGVFEGRANPEDPAVPLDGVFEGDEPRRVHLNERTALTLAPVWQAVGVISGDVAQLPLVLYRRRDDDSRERASSHPAYRILLRRPNSELTPFALKERMTAQCALYGDAYAFIERDGRGARALWPLEPDSVSPVRINGQLTYIWVDDRGRTSEIPPDQMFHLRGFGLDPLHGLSVIGAARRSLGVMAEADEYSVRFFTNNAQPGLVVEFPAGVDKEYIKTFLRDWSHTHGGSRNAGKPGVITKGGSLKTFSSLHRDAQFVELMESKVADVARFFRLPPHKLGDLRRATYSNLEDQGRDYINHSLGCWFIRWTDEVHRKLLTEEEQRADSHYAEFNSNAFVRSDITARYSAYAIGRQWGWLSANDILRKESDEPIEGGDVYLTPLNMVPAAEEEPEDESEPEVEDNTRAILIDVATAASRSRQKFDTWLCEVELPEHWEPLRQILADVERGRGFKRRVREAIETYAEEGLTDGS